MNAENWTFSEIPYNRPDYEKLQLRIQELAQIVRGAKDYGTVRQAIYDCDAATSETNNMADYFKMVIRSQRAI